LKFTQLHFRPNLALALFVLGIVFTISLTTIAWHDALENQEKIFVADVSTLRDNIFLRTNGADEVISNLSTLVNSSARVDSDQFRIFSEEVLNRHPFLLSAGYLPLVTQQDRIEFEQTKRRMGFPTFSITTRKDGVYHTAGRQERYFPLLYQEPFEPITAVMIGFDVLSDEAFTKVVESAIDTAEATPAPPRLLDGRIKGYWLFKAIYAGKTIPVKIEERRKTVNGLIALRINANKMLDESTNADNLILSLRLHTAAGNLPAMDFSKNTTLKADGKIFSVLNKKYLIGIHGQKLTLDINRPLHWADIEYKIIILALLTGSIVTILLVVAGKNATMRAQELQQRNKEIERQVLEKTTELALEKERAQVTLESIGDAVITTDAGSNIEYLNPIAEKLTGWKNMEARGLPLWEVFNLIKETTREPADNPVKMCLSEGHMTKLTRDTVLINRDRSDIAIDHSAAPIRNREGAIIGAVLVFHDVGHERKMAREMSYQATHDALTGLLNRRVFEERLEELLISAKTENSTHTVLYLDLDRFKIVNDACGHIAGDELLRQITALLQTETRRSDTVARIGGDEFGILLYQCPQDGALHIASKLRQVIHDFRFVWKDKTFAIGVSIGLVTVTDESEGASGILSAADAACYTAKDKGRNRVQVFQADDSEIAYRRGEMQWVTRLTKGVEENRFLLYGQTIVPIAASNFPNKKQYEVLIRLLSEDGNEIIPPGAFIPAAERYNLMPTIDGWVINAVFEWLTDPFVADMDASYNINLSGQSLNDDNFLSFLVDQFQRLKIPPGKICLEITETAVVANLTKAIEFINILKPLGCRFALDDFGSGWSSFAYLKNLPVDYLKIDGSFVKDMMDDALDYIMVESINRIGHTLGMQTIAEFVENGNILEKLKDIGVDYAQGYSIDKPRPLSELVIPAGAVSRSSMISPG
jgi:diguanylate cyclase (GGDEF)-like protein/PAS domain S-box-containing protein